MPTYLPGVKKSFKETTNTMKDSGTASKVFVTSRGRLSRLSVCLSLLPSRFPFQTTAWVSPGASLSPNSMPTYLPAASHTLHRTNTGKTHRGIWKKLRGATLKWRAFLHSRSFEIKADLNLQLLFCFVRVFWRKVYERTDGYCLCGAQ